MTHQIKIEDITKSSTIMIDVKCSKCKNVKNNKIIYNLKDACRVLIVSADL